jgi:hypothetical protein
MLNFYQLPEKWQSQKSLEDNGPYEAHMFISPKLKCSNFRVTLILCIYGFFCLEANAVSVMINQLKACLIYWQTL